MESNDLELVPFSLQIDPKRS